MIGMSRKIAPAIWIMLILGILVGCSGTSTYDTTDSISILFVGNSHIRTGNVPGQLQALARMHGIKITYVDVSRNGANIDGTMRDAAIIEMQSRHFDYVVMQARGRSIRAAIDIDGFLSDISIFSEEIRRNGAIPVLYSPAWANINGWPDEELQSSLTQAHKQAAYENDLILVNAGDAWVYAYKTVPGLSLYARDGMHANHAGAFLTASVFAAVLFDLHVDYTLTSRLIDNIPILNIITIVSLAAVVFITVYRVVKKQPLHLKVQLMLIILPLLFQGMSFFPHVFIFMEGGNRLMLLYLLGFGFLVVALYSIARFAQILIGKQSWDTTRKYIFYIIVCGIIYSLTFIPALDLRQPLHRGDNAILIARAAWSFVNPF